jgi:hypothetical protein
VTPKARVDQINSTLEALRTAWTWLEPVLQEKAQALTVDLIGENNEQTRGRIKQLRELMELPETLASERDGISAGLADAPAD